MAKNSADIQAEFMHHLIKATAKKPMKNDLKDNLVSAAISGLTAAAVAGAFKRKPMIAAMAGLGGATSGYFLPRIVNLTLEGKHEEAKKRLSENYRDARQMMTKKANVVQTAGRVVGGIGKATGSALGKGILPASKGATIGQRAVGLATKGAVGYGLYKGVKAIGNYAPATSNNAVLSSGDNYTTSIRNYLVAGQVHPGELTPQDATDVSRLGMK